MSLPNVTATVEAASRALCKLADVKTELGITDSSKDAQLGSLIGAASLVCAEVLGREPWLETVLEKRPGSGGVYLYTSRWPIQSIASITQGTGANPTTVTASDYSIAGARRDRIYKAGGWASTDVSEASLEAGAGDLEYNITYTAGWVMPPKVTTWAASTAFAASAWAAATNASYDIYHPLIFQMDATGVTTGSSEPTWPTVIGGTVVEESQTWTAHDQQTPSPVELAARFLVVQWYAGGVLDVPAGISAETFDGMTIRYEMAPSTSRVIHSLLEPYR